MFNPSRLILARKRKKYTSKELAIKVNVSPVTITRIENGHNEPDPKTIEAISAVLEFPKNFFFESDVEVLTKDIVSFRKLTSMTAKERDAALSAGEISFLFTDWITERFNLPKPDILDLSELGEDVSFAARMLRDYWGLGEKPITNMIKLLEAKGIRVFSLSESTKNVDAYSCWKNGTPYIFLNTFKSSEHSRFDAAHELGHLVLHRHGGFCSREIEIEANNFAASFLMPKTDIISNISFVTSLNQLKLAKKRWGVSISALAYRLHKIGVLSDWQYRNFCIQMSKMGYRTNEPDEMEREESTLWKKIFSELWKDQLTINHVASALHIPTYEIESLIFGLICYKKIEKTLGFDQSIKPHLRVV